MEYNSLLQSILSRLLKLRDAQTLSVFKHDVIPIEPFPSGKLLHFELWDESAPQFNTGNFRIDYVLEELIKNNGNDDYHMMGGLLRNYLSQDGYDKLLSILLSHVAVTPECLKDINGEFMDEAAVASLFKNQPCARVIVRKSINENIKSEGRYTIFFRFGEVDETALKFNMRPCKVTYLFFLLHPRERFTRQQLHNKYRAFTNIYTLLYPTDPDRFENTFRNDNEKFFKQYRPALNSTIRTTFTDHNQTIHRSDDPHDLVWFEIELERGDKNLYSLSLPDKFIEMPKEIKEDSSLL